MRALLAEIFVRLLGPLHSIIAKTIAYGPWGPFHRIIIQTFAAAYKIEIPKDRKFKNLGDFFLRDIPFADSGASLVSPVECELLEGPLPCSITTSTSVKGLRYDWSEFPEMEPQLLKNGRFWNLYLAPWHYHWVHSPCDGSNLEIFYHPGKKYPVNALGRSLCPRLYLENERMSFRFTHPEYGRILMICVGAMGVSSFHSVLGPALPGRWMPLAPRLQKLSKLLAFKLGSTVLLIVEKAPTSRPSETLLKVGNAL